MRLMFKENDLICAEVHCKLIMILSFYKMNTGSKDFKQPKAARHE